MECQRETVFPIDTSKLLELEDGTPVVFHRMNRDSWADPKICVKYLDKGRIVYRHFDSETGDHVFGGYPRLRNAKRTASIGVGLTLTPTSFSQQPSLPDDAAKRQEYPMAEGLLDYFPNALAEVARLSHASTAQHHPEKGMHWDRDKSTDHANKIMRHLVDRGKLDDKGLRHSAMVAWRALAMLQEELEQAEGYPLSRASRKAPVERFVRDIAEEFVL
ncbi:hypothetical protein BSL82_03790 [Tardibacter chloracetimidivorans]|uniref:Uncharacterized protein n=1 Tax=Tardibacter chloracetimidivorans TaxID=1921510 RepID=A0A1L3ZSE4_9SPHN|nr:hypothetical protein BSL82_03790 [Tardibacter chloracetimidivorans]